MGSAEAWKRARTCLMVREFREETGMETPIDQWSQFLRMTGDGGGASGFRVDFFTAMGDLSMLRSMEAEQIEIVSLKDIHATRSDMIENLPWLIPLALDFMHDGRPCFVTATHGASRNVEASA